MDKILTKPGILKNIKNLMDALSKAETIHNEDQPNLHQHVLRIKNFRRE
jgi:hypothetical protein